MSTNLLRRIVRWCGLVLVWAPLAYLPISLFPLSYVQAVVVQVIVSVLAIAAGWVWYREPSLRLRWSPLSIAVVLFLVGQWVCAFAGVDWWQSVWGDMARATGLWYQTHMVVAALIFASPLFTPAARLQVLKSSLYAACIVAALALVQSSNPDLLPNVSQHRVGSTLGNPVLLASYLFLQLGIAAVVALLDRRTMRGVVVVFGVLSIGALVFTQARGTYLGLTTGVVVATLVWVLLRRQLITKQRIAWAAGVLVAVLGVIAVVGTQSIAVQQWARGLLGTTTLTTRLINWGVAWDGFVARPLTGWGPENYRRVSDAFYNPALSEIAFVESYVDKPHNQWLELLATSGVVGGVLFLLVVAMLVRAGVRRYREGVWGARMIAVLVGIGAGHVVQMLFLFENGGTYLSIALLVGWVLAQEQAAIATEQRTAWRVTRPAVWAVSIAVGVAMLMLSIVPLISSSLTNYALQKSYVGDWKAARVYLRYAFDWYTPYQFERLRWSASAVLDMVPAFAADQQLASLSPEVRGWLDRDVQWLRSEIDALLVASPRTFLLLSMVGKMEYQIGALYGDSVALERARSYFNEATMLSPTREEGYLLQTQALLGLTRYAEAKGVMEGAMQHVGNTALVDWYYGFVLLKDPVTVDEGLRYIERAIDKRFVFESATQVEAVTTILVEKQRYERLVQLYEIVVQQLPGDPLWWSRLALAYGKVGRVAEARSAALRAVEIDSSYRQGAEEFLRELDK